MEVKILRISIITYTSCIVLLMTYPFYSYTEAPQQVAQYAQWWFTQPNTYIEALIAKLGMVAAVLTLIGGIALFFLKKWGGYLFILGVLYIISTEAFLPGYAPRSSFESNINSISAISVGCILAIFILSKKLNIFKT